MPLQQGVGAGRFPAKDVKLSGVLVHSRYDRERGPTPLTEAVWPPAPLRDEPPPLLLRVEGMQLTRSGDRLVVINRSIRCGFFAEVCIVSTFLFSPWISFWRSPFHHAALLPYVISVYRITYWLYLFMLCLLAGVWCWFTFLFNLGGVTLDKRAATIKADGRRARPMNGICPPPERDQRS